MKRILFLFSFFFFAAHIFSQATHYTVSGKIIDKETKAPLQGASVFAQNTTFGIATDASGYFNLKLPNGGYELIVTFTGYETESMRISNATAEEKNLVIELKPKDKSLGEVSIVISNEVKDGWEKYGQFFTENFIGKSEFSLQTFIKNPEVLKFYFSKKRNRLKVLASEPLVVQNFALGYNIKFAIDSFTYEYESNAAQFIGYPLFEEMQGTPEKQILWQQNRSKAYHGSLLHFMRSLYHKTLTDEGFEIQFLVKNNEQEKTIPLKNPYPALHYDMDDSSAIVEFKPNQPDVIVIYLKAKPEQAYLAFDPKAKKEFQVSTLTIAPDEAINIEQNGYYFDQTDLTTNGYWGFEKVGDMLPYDYRLQ
ncbi:MAG: carboxypeptidase-like regulatory domain-containing protein [Bacteroidota bacterium]|nr:carboxypeptidase-like regulatory domain-containing protein [Bacteroidota bacterium]